MRSWTLLPATDSRGRALRILAAVGVLLIGWLVTVATMREILPHLNSDKFYLPSLAHDLGTGGTLREWTLQPAPGFFPDLLLYAAASAIFSDLGFVLITYATLYYAALAGAAVLVARAAGQSALRGCVAAAVYVVSLRAYEMFRSEFISPAHHGGDLISGLLLVGLAADGRAWRLAAMAVIAAAATMSDLLMIPQYVAPLVVALLLSRRFAAAAAVGIGAGAGWSALTQLVPRGIVPHRTAPRPLFEPGEVARFISDLVGHVRHAPLAAGFVIAMIVWAVLALRQRRRGEQTIAIFGLLAIPAALVTPLLIETWSPLMMRYTHPLFALPPVLLVSAGSLRRWLAAATAVGLVALFAISGAAKWPAPADFRLPEPAWIACLDSFATERGITIGFAPYWEAKPITFYSRAGLHALAINNSLRPYIWLVTRRSYRELPRRPRRVFLVTNGLSDRLIRNRLGKPSAMVQCEDYVIASFDVRSARAWQHSGLALNRRANGRSD